MAETPINSSSSVLREKKSTSLERSCHDCNRRKVRCNKVLPCDNCVRLGVECTFPPPGRKPRKKPERSSHKAELISRLSLLEREVKRLSGQSHPEPASVDLLEQQDRLKSLESSRDARSLLANDFVAEQPTETEEFDSEKREGHGPLMATSNSRLEDQFGRLVLDRNNGTSRYVNHRVLADLADQIKEVRDLFDEPSSPTASEDEASSPASVAAYSEAESPFLFGYHSLARTLRNYHPPSTIGERLLDVFENNVAPIIRIVHGTMLRDLMQTAITSPDELDKGSEALVFSVYFAAASSMTAEHCLAQLGEDSASLTKRYRFAVEQALARAGFLHSRKLIVLQAAVLFLSCASHPKDCHFVWTMIAVVTRLSFSLGLHRDSSHFGLSPFETEMRRRLWWYIYLLDVRSSESQATSPQIREGDYNTKLPLNINDDDLLYHSVETPQERTGFTDMTLTLVRCEILISHRKLMQMTSSEIDGHNTLFRGRLLAIEECRQALDERYLQFCDLGIPIHWVAATIARVALARLWLVSHFSLMTAEDFRPDLWPDQCDLLILTAVEVLEFVDLLETHENTTKWSWLFQGYVQWQSFAFVLSELCMRPTSRLSDRAWLAVNRVYERWNGPMGHRLGLMMRPLERLMHRAAAARAEKQDQPLLAVPIGNIAQTNVADAVLASHMDQFPQDLVAVDTASLEIFRDVVSNVGI